MSESGIEVEVKVPVTNPEAVRRALRRRGAVRINSETQYDEYYDHPCKSFHATDEAVRLRRRIPTSIRQNVAKGGFGQIIELTYKGPKVDSKSKTRIEVSFAVDNLESARLFLENLGFQYVATMTKRRSFYKLDDITASLDDVEEVGLFLEIEQIVTLYDEVERTRERLLHLVGELGLNPSDSIRESYLELFFQKGT